MDAEFVRQTEDLIRQSLDLYKKTTTSPRISQVWNCENVGDFMCGFFVGEMIGSAISAFQIIHKREPTSQEHIEIVELVEKNSKEINEFFSRFNSRKD